MNAAEDHLDEPHLSIATYLIIFIALLSLTGITVAVAFVDLGPLNTPVALVIAGIKAMLILVFFMHLKGQNKLLWCFAFGGFFWVGLLTLGTMDDYFTRDNPRYPELQHKSAPAVPKSIPAESPG